MNPDEPESLPTPPPIPEPAETPDGLSGAEEFAATSGVESEPENARNKTGKGSNSHERGREPRRSSYAAWEQQPRREPFGQTRFTPVSWWRSAMSLIPKRTRKALRKSVRRTIRRHGPEFAAAIATGVVASLLAATGTQGKKKKKKKKR